MSSAIASVMPHGIHTAVKAVKAPGPDALPNPGVADAEAAQLFAGNQAVLPPRNRCQASVPEGNAPPSPAQAALR